MLTSVKLRNQHKGIKVIPFCEGDATLPFRELISNVPLLEQKNILLMNHKVVDVATGVLRFEGETMVPMDGCNHHTVCQFPDESSSYKLVLGHIRRSIAGQ